MRRAAGSQLSQCSHVVWFLSVAMLISGVTVPAVQAETIYDIQYTEDPSGASPYAGMEVTVEGVVTAIFRNGYVVAEAAGPWHAIFVYSIKNGPTVGDELRITGTVQEYQGLTEIVDISDYQLLSSGNSISVHPVATGSAAGESHESVLIEFSDVTVTSLESQGEWVVDDGTGSVYCGDKNDLMYFPQVGDSLDTITGILYYSSGRFELEPRNTSDVSTTLIPHYALQGDVVTMNDNRDILLDAYLEIQGDRIVTIHDGQPAGIPIVATGGLLFPGLIDAHNHPQFNVLDLIPFERLFSDRYEWHDEPLYEDFSTQYAAMRNYGGPDAQAYNMVKLAEARALCAGTTTIQGANCNGSLYDPIAHQGMGINNAGRFPNRIYAETFPMSEDQSFWENRAGEYWDRFVIHLCEGVNAASLDEFYTWQGMDMLDWRTTLIHGVPLGDAEWEAMAAVDAHLVWSPTSNIILYGATADVPGALEAGVNVALAPDWTESGPLNILEEMKVAKSVDDTLWGGIFSSLQLAEFVTRNAASAMGIQDWAGQIAPAYRADVMVIPGDPASPYDALLEAEPKDVMLTVVNGRPMYGNPSLMNSFPFLEGVEDITMGGVAKRLAFQIISHDIAQSDKPFSQVMTELQLAYDAAYPRICNFLGLESVLSALTVGNPTRLSLRSFPNPSTAATTIGYNVPNPAHVSLQIFDVAGRMVRVLIDNQMVAAGSHDAVWNGTDQWGRRVPAGVYFYRVSIGSFEETKRTALVR